MTKDSKETVPVLAMGDEDRDDKAAVAEAVPVDEVMEEAIDAPKNENTDTPDFDINKEESIQVRALRQQSRNLFIKMLGLSLFLCATLAVLVVVVVLAVTTKEN